MAKVVDRSVGDVIDPIDHNSIKDYIEDATEDINTKSLKINNVSIIDSSGNITTNVGTIDGVDVGTDVPLNTTHRTSNGSDHSYINQSVTTTSSPTFANITSSNNASANNHVPRWDQVTSLVAGLDWQESVLDFIDFTTSEPSSPILGDRYINTATGSSNVTTQSVTAKYIYQWNGTSWTEVVPNEGFTAWIHDIDTNYTYNGTNWVEFGSTISHNNTTGLQGGTTNQYYHLNSTEHGHLAGQNQSVLSTSSPTFNGITLSSFSIDQENSKILFNQNSNAGNAGTNYFYRNLTLSLTDCPVVKIVQQHSTDDQVGLEVVQNSSTNPYAIATPQSMYVGGKINSTQIEISGVRKDTVWDAKQDALVSGTNIKTINSTSLLGSGNIDIVGLPSQTSQSGKFLTTDGSTASWSLLNLPNNTFLQGRNFANNGYVDIIKVDENDNVVLSGNVDFGILQMVAQVAPSTPDDDSVYMYVTASGTTPNRLIETKIKDETGTEVILSSVVV